MFQQIPHHLYIHWPFCHRKCHFCDFVAYQQHNDYQEAYHKILCQEIAAFATQHPQAPVNTIFFGGGTPSIYPLDMLTEVWNILKNHYDLHALQEVTIESNPADITEERLDTWRSLGITRLSMGVQSLDDTILAKLNRHQTTRDVMNAIRLAPKYFDNISIDLILGLPGVDEESWFKTISEVTSWPVKHISVYFLTVHEKTPLYFKATQGTVSLLDDDALVPLYQRTVSMLEQSGFEQYEISNFAQKGYMSIHNQAYWDRKPYKGFGVGASSFDGQERCINENNLLKYLESAPDRQIPIPHTCEKLTPQQAQMELLMLGLRQKKGLDLHYVVYFLNTDQKTSFQENLNSLIEAGLIERQQDRIRLTVKGMALENEIVVRLIYESQ
jgi:oxygen-independent coproporphyrinogen-3 oxidase